MEKADRKNITKIGMKVISLVCESGLSYEEIMTLFETLWKTFATYAMMEGVFGGGIDKVIEEISNNDSEYQELLKELGE